MGAPSYDAVGAAKAQGKENRETAIATQELNMVDQVTPYGGLTYEQIGTTPEGNPRYRAVVNMSDGLRQSFDNSIKFGNEASNTALAQLGRVRDVLGRPVDLNGAAEQRINELGQARLDPVWQRRQAQMDADLVNRGIRPGTQAYSAAMDDFGRQRNDAYNQLALTGRQQSVAEILAERNQPLAEMQALLGTAQVPNPSQSFVSTPKAQINPADIQGAMYQQYQGEVANNNAMIGGLMRLGGTLGGAWLGSDINLKTDIERIGRHPSGVGLYSFRYKTGGPLTVGVMAQEVAAVRPDAVAVDGDGFLMVDYAALEAA